MISSGQNFSLVLQYASFKEIQEIYKLITYLEILDLIVLSTKFFRVIILFRIIIDQLPLFNPYEWPLVVLYKLTRPFFKLIRKFVPPIIVGYNCFNITNLMAISLSGLMVKISVYIASIPYNQLQRILITLLEKYS
jgi:uncharacterized protein YggT (Ycf19 family)